METPVTFFSPRRAAALAALALAAHAPALAQSSAFWTGAVDTNYTNTANWDILALPAASTVVTLSANAGNRVLNLASAPGLTSYAISSMGMQDNIGGSFTFNLIGSSAAPLTFTVTGDAFQYLGSNTNEANRPDLVLNAGSNTRLVYTKSTGGPTNGNSVQLHLTGNAVLDISAVTNGTGSAQTVEFRGLFADAGTTAIVGNNELRVGGAQRYGEVEIAGVIDASGGGRINKQGTGRVIISGANVFTTGPNSTSIVSNGTLVVRSNLGPVSITSATATLAGTGTVGHVTLGSGTLSAGGGFNRADTGLFTIGNLTQSSGATLWVDFGARGAFDRIAATGNAMIASGSKLVLAATAGQLYAGTYPILTTAGGIIGNYTADNITLPPSLTIGFSSPQIVGNNLVVTLSQNLFTDIPGLTPGQAAVAGYLDALAATGTPSDPGSYPELVGVMNAKANYGLLTAAMNQLSPQAYGHLHSSAVAELNTLDDGLSRRFARPRTDGAPELYTSTAYSSSETARTPDTEPAKLKTMHHTLGAEFPVGASLVLGVAYDAAFGRHALDLSGSQADVAGHTGTAYALYRVGKYNIGAAAFYGADSYKVDRDISRTRLGTTVRSTADGGRYGAGLWARTAFKAGWFDLTPYASAWWMDWYAGRFTETGSPDLVMSLAGQSETVLLSRLGLRVETEAYAANWNTFSSIRPFLDVGAVHQWDAGRRKLKADLNGYRLVALTPETDENALRASAGCAATITKNLTAEINLSGQFNGPVDHQFGYQALVSWRF